MPRAKKILNAEELEERRLRRLANSKRWRENHREAALAKRREDYKKNIDSIKARKAIYRAKNKEKVSAYNKQYVIKNRESELQRHRQYYKINKEVMNEKWRNYYYLNKDSIKARKNIYRALNVDKIRQYEKKYRTENPHVFVLQSNKRRARIKQSKGNVSKDIITRLLRLQNNQCACCRKVLVKYQLDHIYPLAKGGEHIDSNIQLLCSDCNRRKNAKHPIDFMQSNGYLL